MRINQGTAVDVIREPISASSGAREERTGAYAPVGRLLSHPRDVALLKEALEELRSLPEIAPAEGHGRLDMDDLALADCILRAHRPGPDAC